VVGKDRRRSRSAVDSPFRRARLDSRDSTSRWRSCEGWGGTLSWRSSIRSSSDGAITLPTGGAAVVPFGHLRIRACVLRFGRTPCPQAGGGRRSLRRTVPSRALALRHRRLVLNRSAHRIRPHFLALSMPSGSDVAIVSFRRDDSPSAQIGQSRICARRGGSTSRRVLACLAPRATVESTRALGLRSQLHLSFEHVSRAPSSPLFGVCVGRPPSARSIRGFQWGAGRLAAASTRARSARSRCRPAARRTSSKPPRRAGSALCLGLLPISSHRHTVISSWLSKPIRWCLSSVCSTQLGYLSSFASDAFLLQAPLPCRLANRRIDELARANRLFYALFIAGPFVVTTSALVVRRSARLRPRTYRLFCRSRRLRARH